MSDQKDVGPAFPTPGTAVNMRSPGMTLRDYFAAKAMAAELITDGVPGKAAAALVAAAREARRTPEEQIAWNAYQLADAMLKERTK
jgi:hypothetical protein